MHELALCSSLIEEASRALPARPGCRVLSLVLRVGPLSGIEPSLLAAAFPFASAGTALAGAQLVFEEAPVSVRCPPCDRQFAVPANQLSCPSCGNWRTELTAGDELLLKRIELTADPASATSLKQGEETSHV